MSQENVEIVRRATEALEAGIDRGEFGAAWDTGAPTDDTEFVPAVVVPEQREYRGREGFVEFVRMWTEDFEHWSVRAERFIDALDDRVVVFLHQAAVGRGSGVPVDAHFGAVFKLERGLIVRASLYPNPDDALEAAGLSE